ncbi:hypothetical protein HJC23_002441 [Cyclotella cryptica]|uniref:NADP-dependent oxidoreductase domain-containing protein n=1 Tax=Cyclotella cryptica TaxID=29204 RepID=A0ABD3PUS6_9STRA
MRTCPLVTTLLIKQLASGIAIDESSPAALVPTFTLANNITIPLIGLGSASGVGYLHVDSAIKAGYRFIDTAQSASWGYKEHEVGNAVFDAKRRWEDWKNGDADDYVCWEGVCDHEPEGTWEDSWKALEEAYDDGIVRSIGICDVDDYLLDRLLTKRIKPTIIQNWLDPYHQDKKLRERIADINMQHEEKGLLEGKFYIKPTAPLELIPQVLINWATQQGVMVLPASTKISHQEDNFNSFAFVLTQEDIDAIDSLDGHPPGKRGQRSFHNGNEQGLDSSTVDPNKVEVHFINENNKPVQVYWVQKEGSNKEKHILMGEMTKLADKVTLDSFHGHEFVFKDSSASGDGRLLHRVSVDRDEGRRQYFKITDLNGEL